MKRILALILALIVFVSFGTTGFAAITNVMNFYDQSTGTNYFFGRFGDADEQVGFQINGKEYALDEEAYQKAQSAGNLFGIGIRDERNVLGKSYLATPYSYTEGVKTLHSELKVEAANYDYNRNMLETLTVKGKEIPGFSPYRTWYYYVLGEGETLELSDISATPKMSLSTTYVTENGDNFLITTLSDYDEPSTVEIITVKKGEYQANQTATLNGYKVINAYYPQIGTDEEGNEIYAKEPVAEVNITQGSQSIYDNGEQRIKASHLYNAIQRGKSNMNGIILVQFDINSITNINDRVILNVPAMIKGSNYPGDLGVIGFDNESPIKTEIYFDSEKDPNKYKGTEAYNEALANILANPTPYTLNALKMFDINKTDYEITTRSNVTPARDPQGGDVATIEAFDVTDYVRSKVLAGEDTVTFGIRAFQNASLSGAISNEAQITVVAKEASLEFTKFEGVIALSDLTVNGKTIEGFDANTTAYNVVVNAGDEIPFVEAFADDNFEVSVTQANEIPGVATIKVTAYDGSFKTYTVSFGAPFENGTFTLTEKHKLARKAGTETFDNWYDDGTEEYITSRVNSATGDPRDEVILQFNATAEGLNNDDSVILTLAAAAQTAAAVGSTVRIVGIVDENYEYGGALPTVDRSYTFTTDKVMTTLDYTEFSFDVTPYVKARLASGERNISFLVEMVVPEYSSSVTMEVAVANNNILPTLTYKPCALSSLTIDGEEIEIVDGQMVYTMVNDDISLPVVEAYAENATVEVTQAEAVPGSAIITVTKYGAVTTYKVNFIPSEYVGEATILAAYSITRATSAKLNAGLTSLDISANGSSTKVRTNSNAILVQEGVVTFNINNLLGVNPDQKVYLNIRGYSSAANVKLAYSGIYGEGLTAGGKYGTDAAYTGESVDVLLTSGKDSTAKIDVTDYVKSKIAAGEETVSFALKLPEGTTSVTFNWFYGGTRQATLTVE